MRVRPNWRRGPLKGGTSMVKTKSGDVLLTTREAADFLGISVSKFRRFVAQGIIPKRRGRPSANGRLAFSQTALDRWADKNED